MAQTPVKQEKDALSPALARFLEIKREHPECLILYRMGDFYETFFEDAVRANRLIGITLTSRGKDREGNPVPMAGVPEKTLDTYLARLVKLGVPVAICEQSGDPSKGLLERSLARIVTPGTITEDELLPQKSDAALVAVSRAESGAKRLGLARVVLSSGEFTVSSVASSDLENELARLSPVEVLVSEEFRDGLAAESGFKLTELPAWHFSADLGRQALQKQFAVSDAEPFGFADRDEILCAVGALLNYVASTQCRLAGHIRRPVLETAGTAVVLDAATRRNLEITSALSGESGPTLFKTLDACQSAMGSRALKAMLTNPTQVAETILLRQNAIETLTANEALAQAFEELLRKLPDLERLTSRIALKTARPKELASLRDACPVLEVLAEKARLSGDALLESFSSSLALDRALSDRLEQTLLEDPAASLREGDVVKSAFDAELAELRRIRDDAGSLALEMEAAEKAATGLSSLRLEFNRVHGYYIEITKTQADNVPAHYIRKQTLKNTERFTTPELRAFEARAISSQEKAKELQRALYDALLDDLALFIPAIGSAARSAAAIDALGALARVAAKNGWVRPEVTSAPGLEIRAGRHPVIERTVEVYTPNDCVLVPGRRLLMITGPNMGGKSTYMRSVALIVLLAHIGSFVPAESARIGLADRILTRIGASDDLAKNRSTFMVEMTEAAAILHGATPRSLVLMDEIGRGTSTFDGLSLAYAIAVELASVRKAFTLFATHYFELTQLSETYPEIANVHVSAVEDRNNIVFLHAIEDGPANQSYGIAVASLAGIPASVIRRARGVLAGLEEKAAKEAPLQLSLFDSARGGEDKENPLEGLAAELAAIQTDDVTPRQALDILEAFVKKARDLA